MHESLAKEFLRGFCFLDHLIDLVWAAVVPILMIIDSRNIKKTIKGHLAKENPHGINEGDMG